MSEILQLRHFDKPPLSSGNSSPWRGKLTSGVVAPGGLIALGRDITVGSPATTCALSGTRVHRWEGRPALACSSCQGLTGASLAPSTAQNMLASRLGR
jgi:hypothetical protein